MSQPRAEDPEVQRLRAEIADDLLALIRAVRRPVAGAAQAADVSEQMGRVLGGSPGWLAAAAAGVLAGLAASIWNRLKRRPAS